MPLIILGLLVVVGIVIYALAMKRQNEEVDTRTVRERYPHVFEKFEEKVEQMKKGANYTIIDDDEEAAEDHRHDAGGGISADKHRCWSAGGSLCRR